MATEGGRRDSTTKRIYVHIGAPKTGTTYVQQVLFGNVETLASDQILYPYRDFAQSFRSAVDFCGIGWAGRSRATFAGEWDDVAQRVRDWPGHTAVVSNELLAGATAKRVGRGLAALGDAEIHIVFSARDLARQLVSDWQEQVKHAHTVTLERFVDDLVRYGPNAPAPFGRSFWGMHDAADVLRRWTAGVPADRVHVVTIPQTNGMDDALWTRFCHVVGLDPNRYDTRTRRTNSSMGVHETELVRRMNVGLHRPDAQSYDALVRLFLAEDVLGAGTARLTLPPAHQQWAVDRSRRMVDELAAAGYQVEGDLDDLIPVAPDSAYVSPTALTADQLAEPAVRAATALLDRAVALHAKNRRLRSGAEDADDEPDTGSASLPGRARELAASARAAAGRVRARLHTRLREMSGSDRGTQRGL